MHYGTDVKSKSKTESYLIHIDLCREYASVVGIDRLPASGGIASCNSVRPSHTLVGNLKGMCRHNDSEVSSPNPERRQKMKGIRSRRKDLLTQASNKRKDKQTDIDVDISIQTKSQDLKS